MTAFKPHRLSVSRLLALAFFALTWTAVVSAQSATGTIEGRISNPATGAIIPGVHVTLEGTPSHELHQQGLHQGRDAEARGEGLPGQPLAERRRRQHVAEAQPREHGLRERPGVDHPARLRALIDRERKRVRVRSNDEALAEMTEP